MVSDSVISSKRRKNMKTKSKRKNELNKFRVVGRDSVQTELLHGLVAHSDEEGSEDEIEEVGDEDQVLDELVK